MAAGRPIWINGEHLVTTTNGTFVAMPLKPGDYRIQAAAQALIDSEEQRDTYPEIVLTAREGKSYFIRQSIDLSVGKREGSTVIMSQGSGALIMGNDLAPFRAELVEEGIGKSECSKLKLIGADPVP